MDRAPSAWGHAAQCQRLPLMLIPSPVCLLSPAPHFTAQRLHIQLPVCLSAAVPPPDPIMLHLYKTITHFNIVASLHTQWIEYEIQIVNARASLRVCV